MEPNELAQARTKRKMINASGTLAERLDLMLQLGSPFDALPKAFTAANLYYGSWFAGAIDVTAEAERDKFFKVDLISRLDEPWRPDDAPPNVYGTFEVIEGEAPKVDLTLINSTSIYERHVTLWSTETTADLGAVLVFVLYGLLEEGYTIVRHHPGGPDDPTDPRLLLTLANGGPRYVELTFDYRVMINDTRRINQSLRGDSVEY